MIESDQLRTLSTVLRTGSFDAAASALNITASAVSQRIKALEEAFGTTLIVRSKPCLPTHAGEHVLRHAEAVALLEHDLLKSLGGHRDKRTRIRIAVNADSLASWFAPVLVAAPDLLVDIIADDQDHSAALLRDGTVVAAITSQSNAVQGADVIPLGALEYIATASPEFVQRWFPDGLTIDALRIAPAMAFNEKDALQSNWTAAVAGTTVALQAHNIPSTTGFVSAALAGVAWGLNPAPLVLDDIRDGKLIDLAPKHHHTTPLYWQVSRIARDACAPLTRALKAAAKTHLTPL